MPTPDTATLLAQGDQALAAGDHETAIRRSAAVLKGRPDEGRAHLGLGEAHLARRDFRRALAAFDAAPRTPAVLQGRGLAKLGLNHPDAAAVLTAALEADPNLWRAWNALGLHHDRGGRWDEADAAYARALQADPGAAEVHNNRGVSRLMRGDASGAAEHFRNALSLDPNLPAAGDNLVLATALQGRYQDALLGVRPDRLAASYNNIGVAALRRGDHVAAEHYLHLALQNSSSHFETAAQNLRWMESLRSRVASR